MDPYNYIHKTSNNGLVLTLHIPPSTYPACLPAMLPSKVILLDLSNNSTTSGLKP